MTVTALAAPSRLTRPSAPSPWTTESFAFPFQYAFWKSITTVECNNKWVLKSIHSTNNWQRMNNYHYLGVSYMAANRPNAQTPNANL